jgi:hypothetical protein
MADERPYLSVVVTARNDDHGGNLLGRMQAFVNGWVGQCKRHRLTSELIFVEWNPPGDRPHLVDALHWPEDLGPCRVRIFQVPSDLHRRYIHAEALPLYQMMAKNAGIRRARGRFVLATNIDIIFSDELAGFLAKRKLQPGRMYRIDRHDVMPDVPIDGIEEQLAYCRTHLIRINAREGTFNLTPHGRRASNPNDIAAIDSGITFGRGWFPVEWVSATENFRWAATYAELELAPPSPDVRHLRLDIEPGPGAGKDPLEVLLMGAKGEQFARATLYSRGVLKVPVEGMAGGAPFVIRFRVLNGGRSIALDTRILEFRVFRCDWDLETEEEPITLPPVEAPECDHDAEAQDTEAKEEAITPPPTPEIQAQEGDSDTETPEEPVAPAPLPEIQTQVCDRDAETPEEPITPPPLPEIQAQEGDSEAEASEEAITPVPLPEIQTQERDRDAETTEEPITPPPPLEIRTQERDYDAETPEEPIGQSSIPVGRASRNLSLWARFQRFLERVAYGEDIILVPVAVPLWVRRVLRFYVVNGGFTGLLRHGIKRGKIEPAPTSILATQRSVSPTNQQPVLLQMIAATPPIEISTDPPQAPLEAITATPPSEISADPQEAPPETIAATPPIEISADPLPAPPDTIAAMEPIEISADSTPAPLDAIAPMAPIEISADSTPAPLDTIAPMAPSEISADSTPAPLDTIAATPPSEISADPQEAPPDTIAAIAPSEISEDPLQAPLNTIAATPHIEISPNLQQAQLHTNGCGDFTLMALENWLDLRGYPEFDTFSMHLDSIFCFSAHYSGVVEEVLEEPLRIYHIEHGTGSGWTPEGQAKLFARIAERGLSMIENPEVIGWAKQMQKLRCPMIFNLKNWGLADFNLPETKVPSSFVKSV